MASAAQITANQHNALLSTGPKTDEGKAASAANSTKHGLSSAFRVLAHEDQAEFDQLIADLREEHDPVTQHQMFLVEQLAKTEWLVARAQRLQACAFDHLAGAAPDPAEPDTLIVAKMFETNPNALTALQRYASQAENSYYKAWRELKAARQLQNEADYVSGMAKAQAAVIHRAMKSPAPNHPAYGADPARSQYGFQPSVPGSIATTREDIAARKLCY